MQGTVNGHGMRIREVMVAAACMSYWQGERRQWHLPCTLLSMRRALVVVVEVRNVMVSGGDGARW